MIYNYLKNLFPIPAYKKIRREGACLIVMNKNLEILYLNETSGFFIENIDGKKSIDDILLLILNTYDVDKSILENDITNLIREMQWKEIIYLSKTSQ